MGLKEWITPTDHTVRFTCHNCGNDFDTELSPGDSPTCPECGSEDVERT